MSFILSAILLIFAQATAVLGNSTMMLELANKIQEKGIRLDSVKKVFLGGTSATYQTIRQIEQSFDLAIIRSVYGSTETGEICAPPMGASSWHGLGFPSPNVQIKVR